MWRLTDAALAELDPRFSALYEGIGRPSIAPERLLRASLLQLLYSIRSERQLVERLEFDMLFRWFVGLTIDEKVFDASTFSKNRDRLVTSEYATVAKTLSQSATAEPARRTSLSGSVSRPARKGYRSGSMQPRPLFMNCWRLAMKSGCFVCSGRSPDTDS